MKKIFISGASGYIGRNISRYLSKKNYKIFCLTTKKRYKLKNSKWIEGKLNGNYEEYLKKSDLLIHCAAAGVYKKKDKKELNKVNNYDSIKFLKMAYKSNCRNWIILGSSYEYGYVKNKALSVFKSKLKPVDSYGVSKVNFYKNLKKLNLKRDCKILYLRVFHVYGGDEPRTRMYPSLLRAIKYNQNFKMTNGKEIRDFIGINEAVKKIYKGIKMFKKKNFFITKHLGSGKKVSIKNFANKIWKEHKARGKILFGLIKKQNKYHSLYSDKKSLI